MKVNCTQARSSSTRHVRGRLKNIELCPQACGEIAFGKGERFLSRSHILSLRLEDTVGLLQIEKGTPDFGFDPELHGLKSKDCSRRGGRASPASARGWHSHQREPRKHSGQKHNHD